MQWGFKLNINFHISRTPFDSGNPVIMILLI